jgi:peroxiredoxin Q/BCP
MISVGKKLKLDFSVKHVRAGVQQEGPFRDLLTRPTIVSVYMRNNTPGCDRQNDSLAAHAAEFDEAGYNLVAVSRDTCGSHLKYALKKKIAYTLVSDPDDLFAKAADSVVEKSMYGKTYHGPARAAYVLDPAGKVLAIAEKVDTADHAAQLKALLATLKK